MNSSFSSNPYSALLSSRPSASPQLSSYRPVDQSPIKRKAAQVKTSEPEIPTDSHHSNPFALHGVVSEFLSFHHSLTEFSHSLDQRARAPSENAKFLGELNNAMAAAKSVLDNFLLDSVYSHENLSPVAFQYCDSVQREKSRDLGQQRSGLKEIQNILEKKLATAGEFTGKAQMAGDIASVSAELARLDRRLEILNSSAANNSRIQQNNSKIQSAMESPAFSSSGSPFIKSTPISASTPLDALTPISFASSEASAGPSEGPEHLPISSSLRMKLNFSSSPIHVWQDEIVESSMISGPPALSEPLTLATPEKPKASPARPIEFLLSRIYSGPTPNGKETENHQENAEAVETPVPATPFVASVGSSDSSTFSSPSFLSLSPSSANEFSRRREIIERMQSIRRLDGIPIAQESFYNDSESESDQENRGKGKVAEKKKIAPASGKKPVAPQQTRDRAIISPRSHLGVKKVSSSEFSLGSGKSRGPVKSTVLSEFDLDKENRDPETGKLAGQAKKPLSAGARREPLQEITQEILSGRRGSPAAARLPTKRLALFTSPARVSPVTPPRSKDQKSKTDK